MVANNRALAYLLASDYEVRLHQNDQLAGMGRIHNGRENECSRDKGYIDGGEGFTFSNLFLRKITRVAALQETNARIATQANIYLSVAGVNRDDASGAVLQETIGETPG